MYIYLNLSFNIDIQFIIELYIDNNKILYIII